MQPAALSGHDGGGSVSTSVQLTLIVTSDPRCVPVTGSVADANMPPSAKATLELNHGPTATASSGPPRALVNRVWCAARSRMSCLHCRKIIASEAASAQAYADAPASAHPPSRRNIDVYDG